MRRVGDQASPQRRAPGVAGSCGVRAVLVAPVLVLVALAAVLGPSRPASAHAIVESVTPPDGSTLEAAPTQVVVTFSEAVLADNLSVSVRSAGGVEDPTGTRAHVDPADGARVVIDLGSLPRGTYQIRLTAHDKVDLHQVVATTSFAVGEAPPPPSPPVIAGPEGFETVARWLSALGLALVVGALAVRWGGPTLPVERPRRLRTLVVAGAAASVAGRLGVLVARVVSLDTSRAQALRSMVNTADAQRFALVLVAAALLLVGERQARSGYDADAGDRRAVALARRPTVGWLGVATLVWVAAWSGHSDLGSRTYLVPMAKAGHLLGLSLWLGVIVAALAATATAGARLRILRALSPVAVFGAGLTVVSGLLLASRLIVSVTALLSTPYGQALVLKAVLAALAVACGWLVVARARRITLSSVELALLGVVVLAGAAMATATPAIDPSFLDQPRTDLRLAPTAAASDLLMQVRAIPGQPGINTLEVRVSSTRRPNPGPVTDVVLTVAGTDVVARPDDDGLALVPGVVLPAGPVPVGLRAHRVDWPDGVASLSLPVEPPVYVHPVRGSSAPLRWPLTGAAWAGIVAGAVVLRRRHRRGDRSPEAPPATDDQPVRSPGRRAVAAR